MGTHMHGGLTETILHTYSQIGINRSEHNAADTARGRLADFCPKRQ